MGYQDLPDDWNSSPIDDQRMLDVIDLCVGICERLDYCLGLLLLDERGCLVQPLVVAGADDTKLDRAVTGLSELANLVGHFGGRVVFVRGRPGGPFITRTDLTWRRYAQEVFGERLAGSYLATVDVIRPLARANDLPIAG